MRTIDADRLLEERRIHTYYHLPNGDIAIPLIDIKNAPTIEPERKKGHWIKGKMWSEGIGMGETYGFYYTCSECNSSVQGGYDVCGKNFCEKCGADNREDGSANADVES